MISKAHILGALKAELEFLEKGGYRSSAKAHWRPKFIFQDSPICPNLKSSQPQQPCSECVLFDFVPEEARETKVPCRYIVLNDAGDTVDSFYRYGTLEDLEHALLPWLKAKIDSLEKDCGNAAVKAAAVGGCDVFKVR